MLFSNGVTNARGVATLLPRGSSAKVINPRDSEGRLLILPLEKDDLKYVIANV